MAGSTSVVGRASTDMAAAETRRTSCRKRDYKYKKRIPRMRGSENERRPMIVTTLFANAFESKHPSWPTLPHDSSRSSSSQNQPRAPPLQSSFRTPLLPPASSSLQSSSNFQTSKKHVPPLLPLSLAVLTLPEISLPPTSSMRPFCLSCGSFRTAHSGTI